MAALFGRPAALLASPLGRSDPQPSTSAPAGRPATRRSVACAATNANEVTLLDYGAGNVRSVRNAIKQLGYTIKDVSRSSPPAPRPHCTGGRSGGGRVRAVQAPPPGKGVWHPICKFVVVQCKDGIRFCCWLPLARGARGPLLRRQPARCLFQLTRRAASPQSPERLPERPPLCVPLTTLGD